MELQVPAELEAKLNRLAEATGQTAEQLAFELLATDRDELLSRSQKRYRA